MALELETSGLLSELQAIVGVHTPLSLSATTKWLAPGLTGGGIKGTATGRKVSPQPAQASTRGKTDAAATTRRKFISTLEESFTLGQKNFLF